MGHSARLRGRRGALLLMGSIAAGLLSGCGGAASNVPTGNAGPDPEAGKRQQDMLDSVKGLKKSTQRR